MPAKAATEERTAGAAELIARYREVRARTERLAAPLSSEDQMLQSMPSASPSKWHRAHTTWFFETFLLAPRGVPVVDAAYMKLFNSYYETFGERHVRAERGLLSRPSLEDIARYRALVDSRMIELLSAASDEDLRALEPLLRLGLAHEEQHQELLLTDILNAFSHNPLLPAYRSAGPTAAPSQAPRPLEFRAHGGGLVQIGALPERGFTFDNELPRHQRWLEPFELADRLLTVGEVKAFIRDGGYRTASLWCSDGWDFVRRHGIDAPLYATLDGDCYTVFGLDGAREASDDEPAVHLSFYEADALARYFGARLPTEHEWEILASRTPSTHGNFLDGAALRPLPAPDADGVRQLLGDAWEWTRSSYEPYPGYAPAAGALGEYNGKFMVNQIVLRGGSCFTPAGHVSSSYRNFWPPETRFQVSGVRLARDVSRGEHHG